jgi:hypothetical protein
VAIAALADTETSNGAASVLDELLILLAEMGTDREDTQNDAAIIIAIEIIGKALGTESEMFISSKKLLEEFQKHPGVDWIKTTTALSRFLSKLDLTPKPDPTRKFRGYSITQRWFEDMTSRYASPCDETETSNMSNPSEIQKDREDTGSERNMSTDGSESTHQVIEN